MKKRILPQSTPTSAAHTTPIALVFHFLGNSELIQGIKLPNMVGFYVQKKSKTTEMHTYGSKIVFAKTNKALHLFLEVQKTTNQHNTHQLDKEYINTTGV